MKNPETTGLRPFLAELRRRGLLVEIEAPVDPYLELAEIHRRVIAANGPALLFKSVRGSAFPVVTNLLGSRERVAIALGEEGMGLVQKVVDLVHAAVPSSRRALWPLLWKERRTLRRLLRVGTRTARTGPVLERSFSPADLGRLPIVTSWPEDGGSFVTLPLVYTEHPETRVSNLGIYRMQRFDAKRAGMHWQIGKGGGFHYREAEARGVSLPVNVFLGGHPLLLIAAAAPLPENIPELLLGSFLTGKRVPLVRRSDTPLPLLADAEFVLCGEVPPFERGPEGPFGDHYGYYSLCHDYPIFHCRAVYARRDAIYPATVVGKPRQEDFYIGDAIQEWLSPIFPVVMPGVRALWAYGETGYHSLAAAVVKERYKREAVMSAFRILGEGQLSLTKFLLVTDAALDLRDFRAVLTHILARARFETDLYIFSNLAMDTLDYTGPVVNEGSRGILIGMGEPVRALPEAWTGDLPAFLRKLCPFCPGALAVEAASGFEAGDLPAQIAHSPAFSHWPLVVLVDDAEKTTRSAANFLWTVFTRFEPAADIYSRETRVVRNAAAFALPLVIDARMKPPYPRELFCDEVTARGVTSRWSDYFPGGKVEMGDSDRGHLD